MPVDRHHQRVLLQDYEETARTRVTEYGWH